MAGWISDQMDRSKRKGKGGSFTRAFTRDRSMPDEEEGNPGPLMESGVSATERESLGSDGEMRPMGSKRKRQPYA